MIEIKKETLRKIKQELDALKNQIDWCKNDYILKSQATMDYVVNFKFCRAMGIWIDSNHNLDKITQIREVVNYPQADWNKERTRIEPFLRKVGIRIMNEKNKLLVIAA